MVNEFPTQSNSLNPFLPWVTHLLRNWEDSRRPILIGINGPQGCGKSTLTRSLVEALSQISVNAVTLSIDDFYLTRKEQIEFAQKHSENPLLKQRGYPGTHDIELGVQTLKTLKSLRGGDCFLPVYDKSQHKGQGDRLPKSEWRKVTGPLDIIFFEGWMLGFPNLPEDRLPNDNLKQINSFLKNYQAWNQLLDAFIHLNPEKIEWILSWRIEAEEKMKASGKPGMSPEEIRNYISQFIPAYEIYLPELHQNPPLSNYYLQVSISEFRES